MSRHKVLLVDDNQELLRLLARLVEAEGWQALPYARGKAAIESIAAERPQAAVVDVLLPDVMGYEVASALRRAGVPFVFITGIFKGGHAASEGRNQHGAAEYFEKPFEANRLLAALRALVPSQPPPDRTGPTDTGTDFDVSVGVEPADAGTQAVAIDLTARPEPPGEGELRDNLPELITAFWLTQQTGELAVQRGKVKKALYFENGRPCFAISNLMADRFGAFLVRVGKLTTTQLELALDLADRNHRRVGEMLVDMGVLRDSERVYYLAQQVKAIAYSLFAWEDGSYRMHFTGRATRENTKVEIQPARLISRGVKRLYRPERLERLLRDDDRLVPTQQPAYPLHEVELEDWEARLVSRVDGTRAVAQLVAFAGRSAPAVRATLWSLVALEILEKARR